MPTPPASPLDNPHDVNLLPSRIPRPLQIAAVVVFVLGVLASGIFSFTEHWRRATFTLGVALLWLSVLRLTCDSKILGVLAVRSRTFDALYTALGGSLMIFLSSSVDSLGS
ncbi:DUF3017 domain-containing protein [Corynebacterium felinum]|uniref:DUF3017 domain-containing protein n=1 Tax=Corynebacterium felinum TaxID=131318 RepID=A0ABU2B855_9CORY|nr:DUF3017 domain-containing protein [Corynebacterium felinum]MDF5820463.1 DUF3017 domain-containing protein [Corynebacterium felinum]MDR7354802.1 hypothetical protein [Corynebacterium felinum]